MRIKIPEAALVVLIGATSSGKSTFAKKHFRPTEVLSSDFFRGLVCDDEMSQAASKDAFDALRYVADKRLANMKLTVVDATNVQPEARKPLIALAKQRDLHAAAIVLDLPEKVLMERNVARPERGLPERVIRKHASDLRRSLRRLKAEGFRFVYTLSSQEEIDGAEVVRTKLWNDKREERGTFDIIGDVHGCFDELTLLLGQLGYVPDEAGVWSHPQGRKAVFLGDLCDRGPRNVDVLRLVMGMVKAGRALCVAGNHDVKLVKKLKGKSVQLTHGLDVTVAELDAQDEAFRSEVLTFLDGLISHYVLADGALAVSHAGLKQEHIGRASARVREFCLYGETTGETDEFGLPVRVDWAADYRGRATVVYGHVPQLDVQSLNGTFCIDTGCVFGGKLTALRWPEREHVSVPAARQYYAPAKPLEGATDQEDAAGMGDLLRIGDVQGKLYLSTSLMPGIVVREENAAAALEVMSRFAADPHWLIYLPPTMSPCETSPLDGYLEHPLEAFRYYHERGAERAICERKHMGSRAVVVLCRDEETARRRFGTAGSRGIVYTRTGRRFFDDLAMEAALLDRLDGVLTERGFWSDFSTDWVCLDAELMPWSAKAQGLLKRQYAPVGRAGRDGLSAAIEALSLAHARGNSAREVDARTSGQNADLDDLLRRFDEKREALDRYVSAYREYCWSTESLEDLRLAPFHLLACEGHVFSDRGHAWHMETLKKYCEAGPLFMATDYITVDLNDEASVQAGVDWWMALTEAGGEGMVVKPEGYIARRGAELLQPAVKCRGPEYLRIIYGPEYLAPEHLSRLKKRSLSRKRALALKELALGLEALDRFVAGEPLYRVHECVFGVLAFESEPVDPRL